MTPKPALLDQLLALSWSQWTALGVNGVEPATGAAVDLEALMVLTAELAHDDPRLMAESVDWCARHHRFASKPRLKQVLKQAAPGTRGSFAAFAAALERHAGGNWPGATSTGRSELQLSGKSRAPDLQRPALLNLRLRALFGVGARADLITALLDWPSPTFSASELVFVGYTKRNLADALDQLSAGGLLASQRVGNRVAFSWRRHHELAVMVEPLPRAIPRWPAIMRALSAFLALLRSTEGKSKRLCLVAAAQTLRETADDLAALDLSPPRIVIGETAWEDVVEWMLAAAGRAAADGPGGSAPRRTRNPALQRRKERAG